MLLKKKSVPKASNPDIVVGTNSKKHWRIKLSRKQGAFLALAIVAVVVFFLKVSNPFEKPMPVLENQVLLDIQNKLKNKPPDNASVEKKTDFYITIADKYYSLGQYGEALDYYKQVNAVDANNKIALLGIANCLKNMGNSDEQKKYYISLAEKEPGDSPISILSKAGYYENAGDYTKAVENYKKYLDGLSGANIPEADKKTERETIESKIQELEAKS